MEITEQQRAEELATFFGMYPEEALKQLRRGFAALHGDVAKDFRKSNPVGDGALLEWYRKTPAYCWELSAYHLHEGFNYSGMVANVVDYLKQRKVKKLLVIGDGIGDMTLYSIAAGIEATYHDLEGSITADFARHRFKKYGVVPNIHTTDNWEPLLPVEEFDAVVAYDFLEHVTDVESWTTAMVNALKPGGFMKTLNAFGKGDDEHEGTIPMHLTRNNRFVNDWDPLVESLGMEKELDSSPLRSATGAWVKKEVKKDEKA